MIENEKTLELELIKDVFEDERKIVDYAPKEMIEVTKGCHKGGDIYLAEDGSIIDLEFQFVDFDECELAKYSELAEELYKKNKVKISIYILCPDSIRVTAPECSIKSEADFNIKLACFTGNPVYEMFYYIKEKVDRQIKLNTEDLENLSMIPMMCPESDRKNLRIKCFRLLIQNNLNFPL